MPVLSLDILGCGVMRFLEAMLTSGEEVIFPEGEQISQLPFSSVYLCALFPSSCLSINHLSIIYLLSIHHHLFIFSVLEIRDNFHTAPVQRRNIFSVSSGFAEVDRY